jgi:hypothetical protein
VQARSRQLLLGAAQGADLGKDGLEICPRSAGQEEAHLHRDPVNEMDHQSRTGSLKKTREKSDEVDRRSVAETARGTDGATDPRTARGGTDL